MNAGTARRGQLRQPGQNKASEIQRVLRNQLRLSDALETLQTRHDLFQPPTYFCNLEQRLNLISEFLGRKERRQVCRDGIEQVGHQLLGVLQADTSEQSTLIQSLFDLPAAGDQDLKIGLVEGDIDDHLALHGMMREQVGRVCYDRVVLGKRTDDVRVDSEPVEPEGEKGGHGHYGEREEAPVQWRLLP